MATITMTNISTDLTEDEIKELEMLDNRTIEYDEDSPRMTKDMLRQFHRFNVIPITIEKDNLDAVKSLGDDFQVELSRIVNDVLRNTNRI